MLWFQHFDSCNLILPKKVFKVLSICGGLVLATKEELIDKLFVNGNCSAFISAIDTWFARGKRKKKTKTLKTQWNSKYYIVPKFFSLFIFILIRNKIANNFLIFFTSTLAAKCWIKKSMKPSCKTIPQVYNQVWFYPIRLALIAWIHVFYF